MRKRPLIGTVLLFVCSPLFADFSVNLSKQAIYKKYNIYSLHDLGVGESGYVKPQQLCVDRNNKARMPTDSELIAKRSNYSAYLKVTRAPNNKVSIEIIPAKGDSKKKALLNIIKKHIGINCSGLNMVFGSSGQEMLKVSTINGTPSLKQLIKKAEKP